MSKYFSFLRKKRNPSLHDEESDSYTGKSKRKSGGKKSSSQSPRSSRSSTSTLDHIAENRHSVHSADFYDDLKQLSASDPFHSDNDSLLDSASLGEAYVDEVGGSHTRSLGELFLKSISNPDISEERVFDKVSIVVSRVDVEEDEGHVVDPNDDDEDNVDLIDDIMDEALDDLEDGSGVDEEESNLPKFDSENVDGTNKQSSKEKFDCVEVGNIFPVDAKEEPVKSVENEFISEDKFLNEVANELRVQIIVDEELSAIDDKTSVLSTYETLENSTEDVADDKHRNAVLADELGNDIHSQSVANDASSVHSESTIENQIVSDEGNKLVEKVDQSFDGEHYTVKEFDTKDIDTVVCITDSIPDSFSVKITNETSIIDSVNNEAHVIQVRVSFESDPLVEYREPREHRASSEDDKTDEVIEGKDTNITEISIEGDSFYGPVDECRDASNKSEDEGGGMSRDSVMDSVTSNNNFPPSIDVFVTDTSEVILLESSQQELPEAEKPGDQPTDDKRINELDQKNENIETLDIDKIDRTCVEDPTNSINEKLIKQNNQNISSESEPIADEGIEVSNPVEDESGNQAVKDSVESPDDKTDILELGKTDKEQYDGITECINPLLTEVVVDDNFELPNRVEDNATARDAEGYLLVEKASSLSSGCHSEGDDDEFDSAKEDFSNEDVSEKENFGLDKIVESDLELSSKDVNSSTLVETVVENLPSEHLTTSIKDPTSQPINWMDETSSIPVERHTDEVPNLDTQLEEKEVASNEEYVQNEKSKSLLDDKDEDTNSTVANNPRSLVDIVPNKSVLESHDAGGIIRDVDTCDSTPQAESPEKDLIKDKHLEIDQPDKVTPKSTKPSQPTAVINLKIRKASVDYIDMDDYRHPHSKWRLDKDLEPPRTAQTVSEDQFLLTAVNADYLEAEARLAQRRAARAEARELRLRELEKQQQEQQHQENEEEEQYAANSFSQEGTTSRTPSVPRMRSSIPNNSVSRRSSEDSISDDLLPSSARELKADLRDLEEKFRKAMVTNAQLDNEKATLTYEVEHQKDKYSDLEEAHIQLTKEHKKKCSENEQLRKLSNKLKEEVKIVRRVLQERDELIQEYGLVLIGEENGEETFDDLEDAERSDDTINDLSPRKIGVKKALLSHEASELLAKGAAKGSLDVRLRKYAEDKNELEDEIRRLKLVLEEEMSRKRKENGLDYEKQKETSKSLNEYKFRIQKAEAEVSTLQANVARLESLVSRYKASTEELEKSEEELKSEKRRLQRELREIRERCDELETSKAYVKRQYEKLLHDRGRV